MNANDAYRKSDMMKWQRRQHRFDIYYMHAYAFAIRLYAGPNWISSVWQQRQWQRHISNWLFAKYFMCVSFFIRIFNSISVGVHSTHENSFWKSGIKRKGEKSTHIEHFEWTLFPTPKRDTTHILTRKNINLIDRSIFLTKNEKCKYFFPCVLLWIQSTFNMQL